MSSASFHKGTWRAEVRVEEVSCGKFQGVVSLFREGQASTEQIERRTVNTSDSEEGALTEAKVLAEKALHDL